ncbi:hypothetical protein [Brevundimonas sp.]|uniref:hypothetical protein n=1 Tax=Brevundimonas sp. TaxID=1871086 RepID=UPI001ACD75B2|nr:hypothetical protein [Brevundimonas sp.]MBN9465375.1 hypothetical protein [Brevundimonas sp.]
MARFHLQTAINAERYIIVPCEADGSSDLAVIWDRFEEQVVDVISAAASSRYSDEDALWDEGRADQVQPEWRMAA